MTNEYSQIFDSDEEDFEREFISHNFMVDNSNNLPPPFSPHLPRYCIYVSMMQRSQEQVKCTSQGTYCCEFVGIHSLGCLLCVCLVATLVT